MWIEDSKPHKRDMGKAMSGFLLTLRAVQTFKRLKMETITTMVAEVLPIFENWIRSAVRDEMLKTLEADRAQAKPEKMLTREEVCEILHISKPTLWQRTKKGKIECVRVGRRVLYAESTIKKYMEG